MLFVSLDELAGFERSWKDSVDSYLTGWSGGFNFQGNAGKQLLHFPWLIIYAFGCYLYKLYFVNILMLVF